MEKFHGTIAVVTGASSGIGLGIVEKLLETAELEVVGLSRREMKLSKSNFSWFKCDVGNAEDVERTFSEISSKFPNRNISILINNAGHTKLLPLLDHEKINNQSCLKPESLKEAADIYKSLMDTNILGPTLVTRAAMKLFDHTKCGNIINVNSQCGYQVLPISEYHFYTMTKHALAAFTEGIRQELRQIGSAVRSNQLSPGAVATEFHQASTNDETWLARMSQLTPIAITVENMVAATMLTLESSPNCEMFDMKIRPTMLPH